MHNVDMLHLDYWKSELRGVQVYARCVWGQTETVVDHLWPLSAG